MLVIDADFLKTIKKGYRVDKYPSDESLPTEQEYPEGLENGYDAYTFMGKEGDEYILMRSVIGGFHGIESKGLKAEELTNGRWWRKDNPVNEL